MNMDYSEFLHLPRYKLPFYCIMRGLRLGVAHLISHH
jgi:hypothetical protein